MATAYKPTIAQFESGEWMLHPSHKNIATELETICAWNTETGWRNVPSPWFHRCEPRTQKARGVHYLKRHFGAQVPTFKLVQEADQISAAVEYMLKGRDAVFFRPCPVRPRHGFVDSRKVRTVEEALQVFQEAKEADPECEALIMPPIEATQSAILTPNLISVGAGHDGATAGREGTVSFPLAHVGFDTWLNREEAGIQSAPYIESVQAKDAWEPNIVQLRDGPAVTNIAADVYATETVTVAQVWRAEGDLLEWEERVKNAPTGTVIHSPGGSMLSHYAVHAVMRGLPVVFTPDAPKVGAVIKATVSAPKVDYFNVVRGMAFGLTMDLGVKASGKKTPACGDSDCTTCDRVRQEGGMELGETQKALSASILAIHQVSAMQTAPDGCIAVGMSVGFMLRAATAACLGESRYARSHGVKVPGGLPDEIGEICSKNREQIYVRALRDYKRARGLLQDAYVVFMSPGWGRSYGGAKWGNVTRATIELDMAARRFAAKQGKRNYAKLIAALHTLLNAVHNGGSWFNKFISTGDLDYAAKGDVSFTLRASYALRPLVLKARQLKGREAPAPLDVPLKVPAMTAPRPKRLKAIVQFKILHAGSSYGIYFQKGVARYPDSVLSKQTSLTREEWEAVMRVLAGKAQEKSLTSGNVVYYRATPQLIARMPTRVRNLYTMINAQEVTISEEE